MWHNGRTHNPKRQGQLVGMSSSMWLEERWRREITLEDSRNTRLRQGYQIDKDNQDGQNQG